jgi:hypothetical protein
MTESDNCTGYVYLVLDANTVACGVLRLRCRDIRVMADVASETVLVTYVLYLAARPIKVCR